MSPGPLEIACPGSKSMTQRALLIAALGERPVAIEGALVCDDSRYLSAGLRQLGIQVDWDGDRVTVTPGPLRAPEQAIYCGNAGTAMRFASCLSLLLDGATLQLDGDERMRQRPIGALIEALAQLGVKARYLAAEGCPPVALHRQSHGAPRVAIDTSQSSQYASGLLMVAPRLRDGLELELEGRAVSLPYLQMTAAMMRRAGAEVSWPSPQRITVTQRPYRVERIAVEPDWSTAAFILAAAEIAGVPIHIRDLPPASQSLQGDAVFVEYIEELKQPRYHRIDLSYTPDLIAPLAALAVFAEHPTTIQGAGHVRIKESDRISVLSQQLGRLGVMVKECADGMSIFPLKRMPSTPIALDPHNDHRMAMAFGLLSLRIDAIEVLQPECVNKSFPQFWDFLAQVRAAQQRRS